MIIRERPNLWQVVFTFRNTVIERIYPQVVMVTLLSIIVVGMHRRFPEWIPVFNGAPFALLGVALSIFLGFRNSACYDRWWEARKHWGELIAVSRDLARQTLLLIPRGEDAQAARVLLLHAGSVFAHALADHLRRDGESFDPSRLLPAPLREAYAEAPHKPMFVLREMGGVLATLRGTDTLDAIEYSVLDGTLRQMNAVLTACERLRNTPVPFGYTLLLLRTAYMFCFLVPLGFADVLGWTTPIAAAVFAYTLFGLDALGDELEEPFGTLPNDLPIRALAVDIEIGLRTSLGETDLPSCPSPVADVLL